MTDMLDRLRALVRGGSPAGNSTAAIVATSASSAELLAAEARARTLMARYPEGFAGMSLHEVTSDVLTYPSPPPPIPRTPAAPPSGSPAPFAPALSGPPVPTMRFADYDRMYAGYMDELRAQAKPVEEALAAWAAVVRKKRDSEKATTEARAAREREREAVAAAEAEARAQLEPLRVEADEAERLHQARAAEASEAEAAAEVANHAFTADFRKGSRVHAAIQEAARVTARRDLAAKRLSIARDRVARAEAVAVEMRALLDSLLVSG